MTRLHELLDDLAHEAKLYDMTERALIVSRRRRHRRRIVAAAGATTATLTVLIGLSLARPAPQPPLSEQTSAAPLGLPRLPTACAQHRLPLPEGSTEGMVSGGDPTGRYLVGHSLDGVTIMWVDGRLQRPLPPGRSGGLYDVNSGGTAVGSSVVKRGGNDMMQAFVLRDGRYLPLKGENSVAVAINEQGVIVGSQAGRPVVWRDPDAEPRPLPVHDGASGSASDIDEDGTIVGTLGGKPHVWSPDGTLRTLPGAKHIVSIRLGWVAGLSTGDKVVRWNLRTGTAEPLSGDLVGTQTRVNALGWAVGATSDLYLRLANPEGHVELPDSRGRREAWLSDDGLIVAGSVTTERGHVPVVWRCTRP